MKIFGMDLWRIILCIILIAIVIKRADIVAFFAKLKFNKRDNEGALKIFRIADKVGNLSVTNKELYGYVLLRCGFVEEANVQLREILPLTARGSAKRNQLKNLIALTLWKSGSLDEAIEELEEVVESGYKNTQIYQNLGILYNLSGNHDKARRFNEEAYDYNKDDNIITDNLADCYAICGEYEKAAELYDELLSRDPEPHFPEAYYGCGRVLIELGRYDEGIKLIEKSLTKPFSFLSIRTKEEVEQLLEEEKKKHSSK
ncbi:MAG: hypothetical protein EGR16_06695 [Clostridiales bacterium]|nr:hypothetical protein [Clostridiales bacterium]